MKVRVEILKDGFYFKKGFRTMNLQVANKLVAKGEAKIIFEKKELPKVDYEVITFKSK